MSNMTRRVPIFAYRPVIECADRDNRWTDVTLDLKISEGYGTNEPTASLSPLVVRAPVDFFWFSCAGTNNISRKASSHVHEFNSPALDSV